MAGGYLRVEAITTRTIEMAQKAEVGLLAGKKGAALDQDWRDLELEELFCGADLLLHPIK
jgi:hypothetical protein